MDEKRIEEGISVVIPAYNESEGVAETLTELSETLESGQEAWEIIVVDDGSTDATADKAARFNGVRVIKNALNMGYGRSLKRGIKSSRFEKVIITDADFSYPAGELGRLAHGLERYDMVVGHRQTMLKYDGLFKWLFRFMFNIICSLVTGTRVKDANSGFRGFKRDAVMKYMGDCSNSFSFTTSVTLIFFLSGLFVEYVPIAYRKRKGASKIRMVRDTLRAGQIVFERMLWYNPLKAFLLLALMSLAVASIFLVFYLISPGIISGLGALGFLVASLLIFSLGMLASAIQRGPRDPGD